MVSSWRSSASAPNCIRKARSFLRRTFEKNWDAARRSSSTRRSWLPLVSTSRPMVRGRSVSRVKYLMSCGLPSSKIWKSVFSRISDQTVALVVHRTQNVDQVDVDLNGGFFLCEAGAGGQAENRQGLHNYNDRCAARGTCSNEDVRKRGQTALSTAGGYWWWWDGWLGTEWSVPFFERHILNEESH